MADNHSYIKCEDFDTLDEAISFKEICLQPKKAICASMMSL